MVIEDFNIFNNYAQSCGNRFEAVNLISRWARNLGGQFNEYRISESKLLSTVLSGKWFYSQSEMERRKIADSLDDVDDFLSWTLDKHIVSEIKRMYSLSIRSKHGLLLSKNNIFSKGELTKINILLRMIWYSEEHIQGEKKLDTYLENLKLKEEVNKLSTVEADDVNVKPLSEELKVAVDLSDNSVTSSTDTVDTIDCLQEEAASQDTNSDNYEEQTVNDFDADSNLNHPLPVKNIRIYNVPDSKSPSKLFSGNIIIKGQVSTMTAIEYVRPGIGLVNGFTPDVK